MMGDSQNDGRLRQGALGPAAIAFFVISAAGPLVAMAGGIPVAMLFGNGPGTPALFLLATILLLAFSTGYTAMAREVRSAGAFYAFAARGLGPFAAGATGMVALLSYNAIQIGLYGIFGTATGALLDPVIGLTVPWFVYALLAWGAIAFFGYRQVDLSAKILGLLVAAEYLVVLVLDMAILGAGGDSGLTIRPFSPAVVTSGAPAIGLMLCFAAFIGFEATTIYSEEARDPDRTVPRATYIAVILIGIFYTFSTWAVVNGAGIDRLMDLLKAAGDPTELLFALSDRFVGAGLSLTMRILFVTSTFAALLAFHNSIARYLFAMGREHILPPRLGRTHRTFASPHVGSLVQSGLAGTMILLAALSRADPILVVFTLPSAIATLGILVLMAIASVSAIACFTRQRARPWTILSTSLALAGFVMIGAMATLHFDLLAGSDHIAISLLPLCIPVSALSGVMLARRLRRRDPVRFAGIGLGA